MKKYIIISVVALLLIAGVAKAMTLRPDELKEFINGDEDLKGVTVGNEYMATSTVPVAIAKGMDASSNPFLIKTGQGSLGSVIVTGAGGAGTMNFYNATTINESLRKSTLATSTIFITSIPTDLVAGTYVYDVTFTDGLIMEWVGTIGTTTITYR